MLNKKKIAIDTDGVLFDNDKFEIEEGLKYFSKQYILEYKKEYGKKIKIVSDNKKYKDSNKKKYVTKENMRSILLKNENGYGIKEKFQCSDDIEKKFWKKNILKLNLFIKPNLNAVKYINQLREDGHIVYNYTARAYTNEKSLKGFIMRLLLKISYIKNKIKFDKIKYFDYKTADNDKANMAIEEKMDYLIDDKKEIIENVTLKGTTTKGLSFSNKNKFENINASNFNSFHELYIYINSDSLEEKKPTFIADSEFSKINSEDKKMKLAEIQNYYKSITNMDRLTQKIKNYQIVIKIGNKIFKMLINYQVFGKENFDKLNDGFLMAFNHSDYLDAPVQYSISEERVVFPVAKIELLQEPVGKLMDKIGSISVDKTSKESRNNATDEAVSSILSGYNVMLAPEGHRNKTSDRLLKFNNGAVRIARLAGCPILPVSITKSNNFSRIVRFGTPIYVNPDDNLDNATVILRDSIESGLIENEKYLESNENSNKRK